MELREALKEQCHAGLAMLARCVEKCPDALWLAGEHPRSFWRVAWHAAYFTHNGLVQHADAFNRSAAQWPAAVRTALGVSETQAACDVEPYELPEGAAPITHAQLLDYISYVRGLVDETVDSLDLDTDETGFPWIPDMSKLSNELENLRHLQGHVGQLSERLMGAEIDIDWIGTATAPAV